jgi:hypothetical protein
VQTARFAAETARWQLEVATEQRQLQAAAVRALQAAATAGLGGGPGAESVAAIAAAAVRSLQQPPAPQMAHAGTPRAARKAEIRKLISDAAAALPKEDQSHPNQADTWHRQVASQRPSHQPQPQQEQ